MAASAKERFKKLGIVLPQVSRPSGSYISTAVSGYLLFTAGQVPRINSTMKYKEKVGENSTLEDAYVGARICAVNRLAAIEQAAESLDHMTRIPKVNRYTNAAPGFMQSPKVLDSASDLLLETFGNAGQHARSATRVQALSDNAVVEVEMTVLLKGPCKYPAV